ncbi:hypothetical protein BJ165DRAFT_1517393 [Panaeolus papilionaceus]|nr:hypothetical protein BJ165DRAFT_1517393 [Panaeolus papilionaceus]
MLNILNKCFIHLECSPSCVIVVRHRRFKCYVDSSVCHSCLKRFFCPMKSIVH